MNVKTFTKLLSAFALILSANAINAQTTYNFQWSSLGWTSSTYSGSLTNVNASGVNVTVGITNSGSGGNSSSTGASTDNNAFQWNTPKTGAANNAWFLPGTTGANPLVEYVDWSNLSANVTTVITFSQPVQAVAFYAGDIDRSATVSYIDQVTVTGKNGTTTVTNPVCTKYYPTSDTVLISGNVAYGNAAATSGNAASTSLLNQGATVLYSFSYAVTSITIVWNQGPGATGNPSGQAYLLGDISFQKTIAPVTTNILNAAMFNTFAATDITDPIGTDADGTITGYTIETLPTAAMGVLTYYNGSAYVAVTASQFLTPAEAASLRFDPAATYTGDASFTYSATDNVGVVSNISTFTIPVDPLPAPTTNNITAPVENNSYGQTVIPSLSGAVASGSIASYTIATIPAGAQGILYLCNPTCAAVTAGQSITEADKEKLKFDPSASFTGNASFTYSAVSNLGTAGNTATYTIPVKNEPPVANTVISTLFTNTDAAKPIPSLTGSDVDGTVASFTITAIPSGSEGVLYLCNPTCAAVTAGQSISLANASKLQFDPAAAFTGTSRFYYAATDNNGNVSPAAAFNMPVKASTGGYNFAPFADNVVAPQFTNAYAATLIPGFSAHDVDGSIASYTIETIPSAAQGVLSYCSNGTEPCTGTVTPATAGVSLTAAQMATLKFDPVSSFTGTASFTYSATDNGAVKSNIANYSIPVVNVPPVANPVTTPAMANTYGQTAIPALSGHDASNIASYNITAVPSLASGVLYLCNPTCNAILTPTAIALADIVKLKFDPAGGYSGTATFSYTATDNNGAVSQPASFNIPVINTSLDANLPPVADNKTSASMPNSAAQTVISSLSGSDPDGTVAGYVINSLPPASQGVLYLCNPACAVVTAGQYIAAADAASLKLDPTAGFEGNTIFNYTSADNSGKTSNVATFTIPVTGTPPQANNVQSTALAMSDPSTSIPSLNGNDPDGTIASYAITSLPQSASGILYLCNPSCALVTVGQVITATDAASLRFDPAAGFTGLYTSFNYTATDNSGRLGNMALYTIPLTASLLPVDLISFTAEKKMAVVQLNWKTDHEVNLQSFTIERSVDGTNFAAIATIAAKGNPAENSYVYPDNIQLLNAAVIYYRLKMTDNDGKTKYSVVVNVRVESSAKKGMSVTPNPAIENVTVKIVSDVAVNTSLRIINSYGEVVYQKNLSLVKGENYTFISSLGNKASGVYTVQALVGTEVMVQKIIISR